MDPGSAAHRLRAAQRPGHENLFHASSFIGPATCLASTARRRNWIVSRTRCSASSAVHRRAGTHLQMTLYGPRLSSAPLARCAASGARESFSRQQLHRIGGPLFQLIERALPGCLVRPPAQDRGAVAKAFAAEVIV